MESVDFSAKRLGAGGNALVVRLIAERPEAGGVGHRLGGVTLGDVAVGDGLRRLSRRIPRSADREYRTGRARPTVIRVRSGRYRHHKSHPRCDCNRACH